MDRSGRGVRNYIICIATLVGLVISSACSVKEDRSPCSCLLMFGMTCPDKVRTETAEIQITSGEGFMWSERIDLSEAEGSVYTPRADLHIRAWTGYGELEVGQGILIPSGQDCPRVYMHDSDVRPDGECFRTDVILRKNHCVMTLLVVGDGRINADLRLKGNVAGYDAVGNPYPGDFDFLLTDGGLSEGYTAVLPRQTDASLMLVIDDGVGNHREFALGRYIVASGYDWTAEDLGDVTVTLDYAQTEIRLVIGGWESIYRYDVEI
ncbi:MAG: hypothetical protein IKY66_11095 [Bacteroidales bacterium]|nr:hypothetical protein [Bacteroidales bacterium]